MAQDERPTKGVSYRAWIEKILAGEADPPPVAQLVGFRLVSASEDEARFELDAGRRHWNPMGTVHGGVLTDVADAAMGTALGMVLDEGETFTTIELHANFFKPVWQGTLAATARLVRRTRSLAMLECDVTDEDDRLVARFSSTCMVLAGEAAAGR